MAFSVCGVVIGYVSSVSTTNRYEVRAAFLIPTVDAQSEYERLLSRKLVASTTTNFRVSRWIDRGRRGLYEMYTESPFTVSVAAVPPQLQDVNHDFRLLTATDYEITFMTSAGQQSYKGKVGEFSQVGAVKIFVSLSKYWTPAAADQQYYITFNSEQAVVDRFLRNLVVVHHSEHPNRIALQYTDAHPDLAFDMLDAFTKTYLGEYRRQRNAIIEERMREVNAELKMLELQIMAIENPEPYLQALVEAKSKLPTIDSSAIRMMQLELEFRNLQDRVMVWKQYRLGWLNWEQLAKEIGRGQREPYDTLFTALSATINPNVEDWQRNAVIDTMIQCDTRRIEQLGDRGLNANARFLSASAFQYDWEQTWISNGGNLSGIWLTLRERYIGALTEAATMQLELRKEMNEPQLIDPPYHIPPYGRGLRLKVLIAIILGVVFFAIAISIAITYFDPRFRHLLHFLTILGDAKGRPWPFGKDALARRQQLANVELSLNPQQKSIVLVGDNAAEFAYELAARFESYDKTVALVNAPPINAKVDQFGIPEGAEATWWLSDASKSFLKAKYEQYDRLLICLPAPQKMPEALAAIRDADTLYFVVKNNMTKVQEWKDWVITTQEWGLDFRSIWLE